MGTVDVLVIPRACNMFVLFAHVSPVVLTFFPIVFQVLNGVTVGLGSGQVVYVLVFL